MWFILGFLLQRKRGVSALPDLSSGIVAKVLWAFALFFIAWLVLEKLLTFLPDILHCNVCGTRLRGLAALANLRPRADLTYPFRRVDGIREEQPVRTLCRKCARRAHRHRRQLQDQT
jgi:hypothetical protein